MEIHYDDINDTLVVGSSGDDSIDCNGTQNVTLDAGAGNDYINFGWYAGSVNGGAGNDTLSLNASSMTINGGKGDDSIFFVDNSNENTIEYGAGDGNDTIEDIYHNLNIESVAIKLTSGSISS
ncbi:MAG: hypothetical protein IJ668_10735 [Selenomonadaceae bacterium]|nr:hypothetical protein [Selenomonadaceae bacterium]